MIPKIYENKQTNLRKLLLSLFLAMVISVLNPLNNAAQPSGGPYGPIHQSYELPVVSGQIYFVAPYGKRESKGETPELPTTIEEAVKRVKTGDAIVLRGGIYRTGDLYLNQGITIQPFKDEIPVLKGTYIADDWKKQDNGLWVTKWSRLFPQKPESWWRRHREGAKTPQHRFNNDMVFADGRFLQSAGWEGELDENSYFIDYESGLVYISFDPTDILMEITAFDGGLIRTTRDVNGKTSDKRGPVIKGITFTQYAYRAIEIEGYYPQGLSDESEHGKDVIGTRLEHCTISYCSRVAGYFKGDSLVIRHCKISDTSTEGIYIISSSDVLLEKNIITRNNIERITGYYPAAVKIFNQSYRVTCNDNLVIDHPYSTGIWYDVGNVDGLFINNWIENVGDNTGYFNMRKPYPSGNGFFFEISKGAVCANNVFINCDHGVWALNSSNVKFYNNTFINSTACISRDTRGSAADHFGWHPTTGPGVDERVGHVFVNNLLVGTKDFERLLLYTMQPEVLCETVTEPQFKELDNNVYVREAGSGSISLISWSPIQNENCWKYFDSPDEIRSLDLGFSKTSLLLNNYAGQIFKSIRLGEFSLLDNFPPRKNVMELPEDITRLIGHSNKYIGAVQNDD